MRVANKTVYDTVKLNLAHLTDELNKANEVVATGKRITRLADDPVGLTQVLNIKSSQSNLKQLGRNIAMGKSWLTSAESALTQVQGIISDTQALTVQMATATTGAAERASQAENVQNMFDELVSLANTVVSGRYIFAGSATDTAPFSQAGAYSGDHTPFSVKLGRTTTIEVGSDGSAVFQPSGAGASDDIFQTLSDLKAALQNNSVTGIQTAMTRLNAHFDSISSQISSTGAKTLRMEMKESIFQDLGLAYTERRSNIEDADIVEAIINLKSKELAYQAALSSASKVMNLSLIDYF